MIVYKTDSPIINSPRSFYSNRAIYYDQLDWVKEYDQYDHLFGKRIDDSYDYLFDLGCGAASAGHYVLNKYHVRYIGFDSCPEMIIAARTNLRGVTDWELYLCDINTLNIECPDSRVAIIIKNILHLMPDWRGILNHLRLFSIDSRIADYFIQETVSPSLAALEWIKGLFHIVDPSARKKEWFLTGDLEKTMKETFNTTINVHYHRQMISVSRWMESYDLTSNMRDIAIQYVLNAPEEVRSDMDIRGAGSDELTMLRLEAQIYESAAFSDS